MENEERERKAVKRKKYKIRKVSGENGIFFSRKWQRYGC
jgi:hypothetical protein